MARVSHWSLSPSSRFVSVSLWPTLLHEIRRLLALWQEVSAAGSLQWDTAATACLDILECLWTTAPDSWSFQAWSFHSMLTPIAELPSDLGVREACRCIAFSSWCCRPAHMQFLHWRLRTSCFWTTLCRVSHPVFFVLLTLLFV